MKTVTTNLKYAYVKDIVLLPNIEFTETVETPHPENEGEVLEESIKVYKTRISITYDIKDDQGEFVKQEHKEHYSDGSETMLSYDEYKAWQNDNEAAFIAADKKELVNYE